MSFYDSDGLETRSMTEYGVSFVMGEPFARIFSPLRSVIWDESKFYAEHFEVGEEKKEAYVTALAGHLYDSKCSVIDDDFVRDLAKSVLNSI